MTPKKVIGIFALVAFALLASSAVCLASAQVSAMNDCSTTHGGAAPMCPFMSVSVPAVAIGVTLAGLVAVVLSLIIQAAASKQNFSQVSFARYERRRAGSRAAFFDPVTSLISRGVLHSRIYSF